jgi:p-aminobenzoyl-glutamate transporter AbgT
MTTSNIDNAQRTAAKVAGWSYLITFVVVVFTNYVLFNPLLVRGNAVETARNIMAHETQSRIVVTCFLTYSAGLVVLLTALYVILKPINPGLALAGALFRLVFAVMWLLSPLNLLSALRLFG